MAVGLTVYVRYSLVEDYYSCGHLRARWERWLNVAGAVCGVSGAVGISIVGNFQVTNALGMHLLGAMLAFFLGVFYCWIQVGARLQARWCQTVQDPLTSDVSTDVRRIHCC